MVPEADPEIRMTEHHEEELGKRLLGIMDDRLCPPALASKLYGQLGFAGTQMFGRVGRSKLRPFKRRQYETRSNVNVQMLSAC